MDNSEKNKVLALSRQFLLDDDERDSIDVATMRLISKTREESFGTAKLGSSGALEILYELGRLLNRLDDF